MYERQNFLDAAALIYACLSVLAGIGTLATLLLVFSAFSLRGTDGLFLAVFVVSPIVFIGLAPSIRRGKTWAMLVALAMSAVLRALLGTDTSWLGWITLLGVALCAAVTVLHLAWGTERR
jgi:hypothetical protein